MGIVPIILKLLASIALALIVKLGIIMPKVEGLSCDMVW